MEMNEKYIMTITYKSGMCVSKTYTNISKAVKDIMELQTENKQISKFCIWQKTKLNTILQKGYEVSKCW